MVSVSSSAWRGERRSAHCSGSGRGGVRSSAAVSTELRLIEQRLELIRAAYADVGAIVAHLPERQRDALLECWRAWGDYRRRYGLEKAPGSLMERAVLLDRLRLIAGHPG